MILGCCKDVVDELVYQTASTISKTHSSAQTQRSRNVETHVAMDVVEIA